jgi:hypothetical protein
MTDLLLCRASESRPSADGQDDYDVIGTDGLIIGRIFKGIRFPHGRSPMTIGLIFNNSRQSVSVDNH